MANIIGASVRAGRRGRGGRRVYTVPKLLSLKRINYAYDNFLCTKKLKLPVGEEKAMEEERERKGGGSNLGHGLPRMLSG